MTRARAVVFFVEGESWQARYQAVTLAVTAAALGDAVIVALFFDPLRRWVDGRFDDGAPPESGAARVASLRETLDEARRELGVEVVACDTAVRLAGLDPAALGAAIDRIETLPSLWKKAREGRAVVI